MDQRADPSESDVDAVVSIVVPVRNEADNVGPLFRALAGSVRGSAELILVYDTDDDTTLPVARELAELLPCPLRCVRNDLGRGPANALRAGFDAAQGDSVLVTMADLSDDFGVIDQMVSMLEGGCDVVCASRYVRGGKQVGGPLLKRTLSRIAGLSLHVLTGLPTHDATNSYRLYRRSVLRSLSIESQHGFEVTLELTVKAWAAGFTVGELPTRWTDRSAGASKFRLARWLPHYLHWYLFALRWKFLRTFWPGGLPKLSDGYGLISSERKEH